MDLIYDMPIPLGEPHDVVSIAASKLSPALTYNMGTNSRTGEASPYVTLAGQERVERNGKM